MWLLLNDTLNNKRELLLAGKALCLCQKFEGTCKDIVMWLCSTDSLIKSNLSLLSNEHAHNVDELLNLLLGQSITKLEKTFKNDIDKKDIDVIREAKNSRNFVCHELLKGLISASFARKEGKEDKREIIEHHIKNIAAGDYLVSKWSYELHEKESGTFYNRKRYVSRIIEWVQE